MEIPRGKLGAGPVERLWRKDREALIQCGEMHDAALQFYEDRDKRLQAAVGGK